VRIAIMQPYLFPYLGYFQLVHAVDEFVIFDDVQYIKRGWVNRNRLLKDGAPFEFTAAVLGASQTRTFNEVAFGPADKLARTIVALYGRAPHFKTAYPLLDSVLRHHDRSVPRLIRHSLEEVARYAGLPLCVSYASELRLAPALKGQDRILRICQSKRATAYLNLPGGAGLYAPAAFGDANIDLQFIHPDPAPYQQFGEAFVPGLSMIDVLMFNAPAQIRALLTRYRLLPS
jgi:hypothetical protein